MRHLYEEALELSGVPEDSFEVMLAAEIVAGNHSLVEKLYEISSDFVRQAAWRAFYETNLERCIRRKNFHHLELPIDLGVAKRYFEGEDGVEAVLDFMTADLAAMQEFVYETSLSPLEAGRRKGYYYRVMYFFNNTIGKYRGFDSEEEAEEFRKRQAEVIPSNSGLNPAVFDQNRLDKSGVKKIDPGGYL